MVRMRTQNLKTTIDNKVCITTYVFVLDPCQQGSLISDMEWSPKSLFWKGNDSVVKLMFSITVVFLCDTYLVIELSWIMTAIANAKNLRQRKTRFSFIVEQILAFVSTTNLFREVKNVFPTFKRISWRCFTL